MTRKKKIVISASVLITIVSILGFVLIAGAFGPDGFHTRGMPHFMKKEIQEFILWKMDKTAKELNLNTAQQKNYNTFRTRLDQTINTGLEARLDFEKQAIAELDKDTPELSAITTNLQSHIDQMSSKLSENLTLFNTFYNSLDATQKKQITDHIKEKHQACKDHYPALNRG